MRSAFYFGILGTRTACHSRSMPPNEVVVEIQEMCFRRTLYSFAHPPTCGQRSCGAVTLHCPWTLTPTAYWAFALAFSGHHGMRTLVVRQCSVYAGLVPNLRSIRFSSSMRLVKIRKNDDHTGDTIARIILIRPCNESARGLNRATRQVHLGRIKKKSIQGERQGKRTNPYTLSPPLHANARPSHSIISPKKFGWRENLCGRKPDAYVSIQKRSNSIRMKMWSSMLCKFIRRSARNGEGKEHRPPHSNLYPRCLAV